MHGIHKCADPQHSNAYKANLCTSKASQEAYLFNFVGNHRVGVCSFSYYRWHRPPPRLLLPWHAAPWLARSCLGPCRLGAWQEGRTDPQQKGGRPISCWRIHQGSRGTRGTPSRMEGGGTPPHYRVDLPAYDAAYNEDLG